MSASDSGMLPATAALARGGPVDLAFHGMSVDASGISLANAALVPSTLEAEPKLGDELDAAPANGWEFSARMGAPAGGGADVSSSKSRDEHDAAPATGWGFSARMGAPTAGGTDVSNGTGAWLAAALLWSMTTAAWLLAASARMDPPAAACFLGSAGIGW